MVLEMGSLVGTDARSTYMDRAVASMAMAMARARAGDREAIEDLAVAVESVDATDDVVARAVMHLAHASVLSTLGQDGAMAACDAAEQRLGELGLDAPGWRTVMRLALDPSPASV
jgi:hypothetical protein